MRFPAVQEKGEFGSRNQHVKLLQHGHLLMSAKKAAPKARAEAGKNVYQPFLDLKTPFLPETF